MYCRTGLIALNLIQIPGLFLIILFEGKMPGRARHDIRFHNIIQLWHDIRFHNILRERCRVEPGMTLGFV